MAEGKLSWNRVSQWAQVSDDGQYSVACIRVKDAYRFEAWHLNGGPGKDVNLGIFDAAEVARDACYKHRAEQLRIAQQLEGV